MSLVRALAPLARRLLTGLATVAVLAVAAAVGVPHLLGMQTYAITTGSMAGTADPGSLVVARPVPVDELAVGDVITYLPPAETGIDHLVTHRIAAMRVETALDGRDVTVMTTRGDANAADDPWDFVLDAGTQPRMAVALPWLGHPVLWLGDPIVRLLAIFLPAVAIALLSAVDLVREWRRPDATVDADPPADSPPDVVEVIDLTDAPTSSTDPRVFVARP